MKISLSHCHCMTTMEVNSGIALPLPLLPLLTGVWGYNPRIFFLKLKVLVGEF